MAVWAVSSQQSEHSSYNIQRARSHFTAHFIRMISPWLCPWLSCWLLTQSTVRKGSFEFPGQHTKNGSCGLTLGLHPLSRLGFNLLNGPHLTSPHLAMPCLALLNPFDSNLLASLSLVLLFELDFCCLGQLCCTSHSFGLLSTHSRGTTKRGHAPSIWHQSWL